MLLELWKCGENEKNCNSNLGAIDLRPHIANNVFRKEKKEGMLVVLLCFFS
jgi:hypothetical protein